MTFWLPSTCTAVISAAGVEFWVGSRSAPRQILKVPSSRIRDVTARSIRVTSLVRASMIFDIDGPPLIELPLSPIGSGLFGYGPLPESRVRELLGEFRRELGFAGTGTVPEASES
jgi:hypothetical protein